MNQKQFQTTYHEYQTHLSSEATDEATKVNQEAEGFQVEAVCLGALGWCLMLKVAATEVRSMNIIPDIELE